MKILVADDEQAVRESLRRSLRFNGYDVVLAVDGEDALDQIRIEQPDLTILDLMMPKLDGLGLLRAIRAHPPISKTAYIMLTGQADKDLVQRAVQFGVNNYLVKPFTVATLKQKIEAVFGPLT